MLLGIVWSVRYFQFRFRSQFLDKLFISSFFVGKVESGNDSTFDASESGTIEGSLLCSRGYCSGIDCDLFYIDFSLNL